MSKTPETDKIWESTVGFTDKESKYILRTHAKNLEFERDRARDSAEKSFIRVFQLRAAIDEIRDSIDEFREWGTCSTDELINTISVITHKVTEV